MGFMCPNCGKGNGFISDPRPWDIFREFTCPNCGQEWLGDSVAGVTELHEQKEVD